MHVHIHTHAHASPTCTPALASYSMEGLACETMYMHTLITSHIHSYIHVYMHIVSTTHAEQLNKISEPKLDIMKYPQTPSTHTMQLSVETTVPIAEYHHWGLAFTHPRVNMKK